MLQGAEVASHKSPDSCWIVIDGKVYDVTKFLDKHPGGRSILLRQAGAVSDRLKKRSTGGAPDTTADRH